MRRHTNRFSVSFVWAFDSHGEFDHYTSIPTGAVAPGSDRSICGGWYEAVAGGEPYCTRNALGLALKDTQILVLRYIFTHLHHVIDMNHVA